MKTFIFKNDSGKTEVIEASNSIVAWDILESRVGDTSNWFLQGAQG